MKKILNVPYYSQRDVENKEWKDRSCAIVCLKMILDYHLEVELPSVWDLIREGVMIDGVDENSDWKQDSIVMLLRNHGLSAYRQEFKSFEINIESGKGIPGEYSEKMLTGGINKIVDNLNSDKPVLASVSKMFGDENIFHMVVLVGFEKDGNGEVKGFYYNDSDYEIEQGKALFVDIEIFKKHWRRLSIFIE